MTGKSIDDLQKKANVYYDPSVYSGPSASALLQKTLSAQVEDPKDAFKAKSKIVASENYMLYSKEWEPLSTAEMVPFKILSHAGVNVEYGQNGHDHEDFATFVKAQGVLHEAEFLSFMKHNLRFQLKAMEVEEVEVPVLVAIGGGVFSTGFQPRYSEIVAQAYSEILESREFSFKAVVFALPKFKPEDNIDRFMRIFSSSTTIRGYAGAIPVILYDTDVVEIAHRLGKSYRTGMINPADSHSIAGMYWESDGSIALEESLAFRTTLLLTQHLRLNPRVLDSSLYIPLDIPATFDSKVPGR